MYTKKIFICIVLTLLIVTGMVSIVPQNTFATQSCSDLEKDGGYCLIEPLQIGTNQVYDRYDPKTTGIGSYVNLIIKVFIGIIGVLGVIMIVLGGIQYMSTDAISKKEGGREMITHSVFGLLLALSSFLILNTINPQLVEIKLQPSKTTAISVAIPYSNMDFSAEEKSLVTAGFKMNGTMTSPQPGTGVAAFITSYLSQGYIIDKVTVDTAAKTSTWQAVKGTDKKLLTTVVTGFGANGIAAAGTGVMGDKKTPKGTSITTSVRRAESIESAVKTNDGVYNLGAVFMNTGIKDGSGNDRGIGFHGNASNTPAATAGCIRMYNDDLVALGPYFKSGINVLIQ